jgi:hypothetical protein
MVWLIGMAAVVLAVWMAWRFLCWCADEVDREVEARQMRADAFPEAQLCAIALAHPMAHPHLGVALGSTRPLADRESVERVLKPALLHLFQLRPGLDAQVLRERLTAQLKSRWFAIDLDKLHAQDDPRHALAFACARVAFGVRAAGLLGWIDEDTQWQLLLQNAQRARDCFSGWQDFASAWARGRSQWVQRGRADSLGVNFSDADIAHWLADRFHPWACLPWEGLQPASA